MVLIFLIGIPLAASVVAWYAQKYGEIWPRWIALIALAIDLALGIYLLAAGPALSITPALLPAETRWHAEVNAPWLPGIGIGFHVAADGLGLLLVLLTALLGIMAVASAWTEIRDRIGFFHFNLLWCLAGIIAVFLAMDLFLFYFFWELMLVPMYFLIAFWGHENRAYAAIKFFIFTQLSGLLMLAAILGLYFVHGKATGTYTFDYFQLLGTPVGRTAAAYLFSGFLIAFLVKLPAIPLHTWLPDAHTEAPTAGSVILAGLLLKTGAYGIFRFAIPLFPSISAAASEAMMILAVIGILYGAAMAFAQTDLKRLVAYTSVSHMGFVLLGLFAWNELALQGAMLQIICHGISTGALFMVVGALQERIKTREMARMGGLWAAAPRMGGITMLFALASLGLPGMGNFIGEFLVLFGTYRVSVPLTAAATAGLIFSTVYAVWMIQRAFFGENRQNWEIPDLDPRETVSLGILALLILWLGLYPQPVIMTAGQGFKNLAAAGRPYISIPAEPAAFRAEAPDGRS